MASQVKATVVDYHNGESNLSGSQYFQDAGVVLFSVEGMLAEMFNHPIDHETLPGWFQRMLDTGRAGIGFKATVNVANAPDPVSDLADIIVGGPGAWLPTTFSEHERLGEVSDKSQAIGEFLEWLNGQGIEMAHYPDRVPYGGLVDTLYSTNESTQAVLSRYFSIDLELISAEKEAMIEGLRRMQDAPSPQ